MIIMTTSNEQGHRQKDFKAISHNPSAGTAGPSHPFLRMGLGPLELGK